MILVKLLCLRLWRENQANELKCSDPRDGGGTGHTADYLVKKHQRVHGNSRFTEEDKITMMTQNS